MTAGHATDTTRRILDAYPEWVRTHDTLDADDMVAIGAAAAALGIAR